MLVKTLANGGMKYQILKFVVLTNSGKATKIEVYPLGYYKI